METVTCFPFTSSEHCFQHIPDPLLRSSKLLEDFGLNNSAYGFHIVIILLLLGVVDWVPALFTTIEHDIRKEATRLLHPVAQVLVYQSGYVLHSGYIFCSSQERVRTFQISPSLIF